MTTNRWHQSVGRYFFDFKQCSYANGYAQVDTSQDAYYFGTWANPETLTIVTYCEGDIITQIADTPAEFRDTVLGIQKWNQDQGHTFYGIDCVTHPVLLERFKAIGLGELIH